MKFASALSLNVPVLKAMKNTDFIVYMVGSLHNFVDFKHLFGNYWKDKEIEGVRDKTTLRNLPSSDSLLKYLEQVGLSQQNTKRQEFSSI